MRSHLQQALQYEPQFAAAHQRLARLQLAEGKAEAVVRQLDTLSTETQTAGILVALADAYVLTGAPEKARPLYVDAFSRVPSYASDTRTQLLLRDAVAERPDVVHILVSGDSAQVQARRLAALGTNAEAVEAWRGVRLMDARSYEAALQVWRRPLAPVRAARPRGWGRIWDLQQMAWRAKAAEHAGHRKEAHRWALMAARKSQRLGDLDRAAVYEWWAERSLRGGQVSAEIQEGNGNGE